MRHIWRLIPVALALSACSTLPNGDAPTTRTVTTTTPETVRGETLPPATQQGEGFQISQCFSPGAPTVGINYPDGWSRRVSRAETEDELLGGSSTNLSETGAYAQPVGAVDYTYPQLALNPSTEGVCEVKFNLSRTGDPSDIISACSSNLFLGAATDAVKGAKFKPVRVNGSAAKGVNLTYQMKFCLAD